MGDKSRPSEGSQSIQRVRSTTLPEVSNDALGLHGSNQNVSLRKSGVLAGFGSILSRPSEPGSVIRLSSRKGQKYSINAKTLLGWESHDYSQVVNGFTRDEKKRAARKKRKCFGYSGRTFTRWILTWAIGCIMGAIASGISHSSELLTSYRRNNIIRHFLGRNPGINEAILSFTCYALWNLMLTITASLLVIFVSNKAAVSGIPEVKATLNGIKIPGLLTFGTLFSKIVGTICVVSSGLILGPEGPLVHIGAIIGSSMTRGRKNIKFKLCGKKYHFRVKIPWLMQFRNDIDRRDFISIGAASGFAAAFGAPIGAVLFALEEAASWWNNKLMWRALTATTLATVVLHLLDKLKYNLAVYGLISLEINNSSPPKFWASSLIPLAVIGVIGGIMGAAFNSCYQALSTTWFR
jgi:chloride channel 7